MLFEKSKFSVGDIVSLKIISGEEVIGKYTGEDMTEMNLAKPLMLAVTSKGPVMTPVFMTVDPEKEFAFNKNSIIAKGHTVKEIAEQYTYQTTGIQPVNAGGIITG